jgi:hypothetical protein
MLMLMLMLMMLVMLMLMLSQATRLLLVERRQLARQRLERQG